MINVHFYLDTRAVAKGQAAPLKLDFCRKRSHALLSVGIRLLPSHWDAKAQRCVGDCQNKEQTNCFLLQRMARVSEILMKLTTSDALLGLSVVEVKNRVASELAPDVGVENRLISRMRAYASLCKSKRTADIYLVTVKKVLAFDSRAESLTFESVSKDWLSRFDSWLASDEGGCPSVNARSVHLRNIRAVFNDAIDNGITSWYPFRTFKVKNEATKKRAVSVEVLRSLFSFPVTWQRQYVDAFKLSFCLIGINVVDLLALRADQLVDGRLSYRRSKTGRLYDIKVEPEAAAIIEKYHGSLGRLVSWGENRKVYTTFTFQMCRGLKSIGTMVKEWRTDDMGVYREVDVFRPAFPMLSSYVARHSWATIAASLDVPKDVIAHALGHGGSSVTDIYIDFDMRKVDEANRRVLDWVFYGKK